MAGRLDWYKKDQLKLLDKHLCIFDLLQIKRKTYSHWVMYLGISTVENRTGMIVIHRNGNNEENVLTMTFGSKLSNKEKFGIGTVTVSFLVEVLEDDKCRINNNLDNKSDVNPMDIIEKRIFDSLIEQEDVVGAYNVTRNNCEHFVKWLRYGIRLSYQVEGAIVGATAVGGGVLGGLTSTVANLVITRGITALATSPAVLGAATGLGGAALLAGGCAAGAVAGVGVIAYRISKKIKEREQERRRERYMITESE